MALAAVMVLLGSVVATESASATSDPATIDLNGAALKFNPGSNVGANSAAGFTFEYKGVATVGSDRIDARITIISLENVAEDGATSCTVANSPRVARLDRNVSPLDAIRTVLLLCPRATADAPPGFVEYRLDFFVTTTTDANFGTAPVILKNLVANFTDVDNNEFYRLSNTKSFRKHSTSTVTTSYDGSTLVFTGQDGDLAGTDSTTKGQVEASFIDSSTVTIRLGRTRTAGSPGVGSSDFFVDFRGVDLGEGATSADSGTAALPGAPLAPTVVAGDEKVTVTPVAGPGGVAETYLVTANTGQTCTVTAPAVSCDVEGLTNGVAYTFTVTATNGSGTSAASPASASATPAAVPVDSGSGNSDDSSGTSNDSPAKPPALAATGGNQTGFSAVLLFSSALIAGGTALVLSSRRRILPNA